MYIDIRREMAEEENDQLGEKRQIAFKKHQYNNTLWLLWAFISRPHQ